MLVIRNRSQTDFYVSVMSCKCQCLCKVCVCNKCVCVDLSVILSGAGIWDAPVTAPRAVDPG